MELKSAAKCLFGKSQNWEPLPYILYITRFEEVQPFVVVSKTKVGIIKCAHSTPLMHLNDECIYTEPLENTHALWASRQSASC